MRHTFSVSEILMLTGILPLTFTYAGVLKFLFSPVMHKIRCR